MRDPSFYVSGLLELHKQSDAAERRASWRQSMAALARAAVDEGPGPLEGIHPDALLAGVRAALQSGLVDDLDWLAPPAAGSALYELASALPLGAEQRDLGRRLLARLLAADASTFAAVARRMALGTGKGLASAGIRARVALVVELPIGLGVADGPLALSLASRRDLARDWISLPSTGSLPARRLAARLLERAAREASRRASYGDDHCLRTFKSDAVAAAWQRLLADRESLVWRHVAIARGLLAPWVPEFARAIEEATSPAMSPTEWRRAATSIAANVAVAPGGALSLAKRALSQGMLDRDPGAASAFVWGLSRAAEAEAQAAEELLDSVLDRAPPETGEAIVDLRRELGDSPLTERAARRGLELFSVRGKANGDDGAEGLALEIARDLDGSVREDQPLRDHIARALATFASLGAREAYGRAREALVAAYGSLDALEAVTPEEDGAQGRAGSIARRASLAVLRDLDVSLLERDVLEHLLSLGGGGEAMRTAENALDPLRDRLATWILAREQVPLVAGEGGVGHPTHPTLSLRRLRALLHLVDGDVADESEPLRAAQLRDRCLRIARVLLERFERGPPSAVRRTIVAALARALDALVRMGACDAVDALLVVARNLIDPAEYATLAEASMNTDLVHVLERYGRFVVAVTADPRGALPAYEELARDLAPDASARTEALRAVLVRLGNALAALSAATSLRTLSGKSEPEAVTQLEGALSALAQLVIGARARFDPRRATAGRRASGMHPLTVSVTRVLAGAEPSMREHVVAAALDDLLVGVPKAIGMVVSAVVWRLSELPAEGRSGQAPVTVHVSEALPAWLPPRRTLGGFYVLRALSAGAVGSVFVVTRDEDRGDAHAEKLALKVPQYSANAARHLSEAEFLNLFREEASALIALPQHPNLARFVTFDAGSKPKPILVMELVEGVTLERLLEAGGLDTPRALRVLDDVLRGLEAMHAVGVGHLDLKPSNVVMRGGEQAVLVDFGLAGRHIRPGCATGPYGAPEVWGALDGQVEPSPAKADIYAFGCVAFETLTGRVLFDADTEMAQIAFHVSHDGFPPAVRALAHRPELGRLAELLFSTLRRDPADRPTAATVRGELLRLAPILARVPWPIDPWANALVSIPGSDRRLP